MPSCSFHLVDAFTSRAFCGNPCAVVSEADGLTDADMQRIARETNAPETAFVFSPTAAHAAEGADVRVRYFMPRQEIPFAGHPTIATAFLLRELGRLPAGRTARFAFNIGILPVDIPETGHHDVIMRQPVPVMARPLDQAAMLAALRLEPSDSLNGLDPWLVQGGVAFVVMPVAQLNTLHAIRMNRDALGELLREAGVNAVYVFTPGGVEPGTQFHARLLDPFSSGEDPYTGSAAGCLAAYVVAHKLADDATLVLEQGHVLDRPGKGVLHLERHEGDLTGLRLAGPAVITAEGRLRW